MKIDLDQKKADTLAAMVKGGGAGVEALSDLFAAAESELRDVLKIDPKGNMGLQTLARQHAVDMLLEVRDVIFTGVLPQDRPKDEKPAISKWR